MDASFHDMEQVFCCIDNVLLVTHDGFDDHTDRLEGAIQRLRDFNAQAYTDETFLASVHFDCLGRHLPPNGIKPQ